MKKSELINELNKIKGDPEILFMTDYEVCADDWGYWKSNSINIKECIEAHYNERIYTDKDALEEDIADDIDDASYTEETLNDEVDRVITEEIKPERVIGIFLSN